MVMRNFKKKILLNVNASGSPTFIQFSFIFRVYFFYPADDDFFS